MNEYEKWAWNHIKQRWNEWYPEAVKEYHGPYVSNYDVAIIEGSREMWRAIGYEYPDYLYNFCQKNADWWFYALDIRNKNHDNSFREEDVIGQWIWPHRGFPKGTWAYLAVDAAIVCLSWDWYNVTPQRILDFVKNNPEIKEFFLTSMF